MKQFVIKNWKTTLAGCLIAAVGYLVHAQVLTGDQGTLVTAILTALGFTASKDGNVSGTGTN